MTSTRAINAAAGVIHAAMQQGWALPANIAFALDSAGLLNSPEVAVELEELRKLPARVAELVAQLAEYLPVDEQRIPFALTPLAEVPDALIASSGAVIETPAPDDVRPQVAKLRALLAGQREDAYVSPLHRDYRTPHDLPPVTS